MKNMPYSSQNPSPLLNSNMYLVLFISDWKRFIASTSLWLLIIILFLSKQHATKAFLTLETYFRIPCCRVFSKLISLEKKSTEYVGHMLEIFCLKSLWTVFFPKRSERLLFLSNKTSSPPNFDKKISRSFLLRKGFTSSVSPGYGNVFKNILFEHLVWLLVFQFDPGTVWRGKPIHFYLTEFSSHYCMCHLPESEMYKIKIH